LFGPKDSNEKRDSILEEDGAGKCYWFGSSLWTAQTGNSTASHNMFTEQQKSGATNIMKKSYDEAIAKQRDVDSSSEDRGHGSLCHRKRSLEVDHEDDGNTQTNFKQMRL
jgi:hypothetical protein